MSVNIHYTIKQLQSLSNNLYNSVLVHLKINCNKLILICNSINYFLIILRWCLSSYKQCYRLNMVRLWNSKGLGSSKLQWSFEASRLEMKKRDFNCVSLTNSHTRRGAFVETNPPVVLSSIRIPTLGRVWYHAPWLRHCRKYRQCGLLLFGCLLW